MREGRPGGGRSAANMFIECCFRHFTYLKFHNKKCNKEMIIVISVYHLLIFNKTQDAILNQILQRDLLIFCYVVESSQKPSEVGVNDPIL